MSEENTLWKEGERKLRILAFPANEGGCSYYRIIMPINKLLEKHSDEIEVRFNQNPLEIDKETGKPLENSKKEDLKWCDIIFTQNISNFGPKYMLDVFKWCRENNKFIHYDTDDLLTNLYPGHRLEGVYKNQGLAQLTEILYHNADLVSVTQEKFAKRVAKFCRGALCIMKDAIDYDLPCWNLPRIPAPKKVCRIGWVGGIHHEQDVKQISKIALTVNSKVGPERVHWGFYGRPPMPPDTEPDWQQDVWDNYEKILTTGVKHRNFGVFPAAPSHLYGAMYRSIDISIAPLEYNDFNDSKSEIKVMECGRYGVPLVATNCGCYDEVVKNGVNGYLISKDNPVAEWTKVLTKLIKDRKYTTKLGADLKLITDERFNINSHIGQRLNLYKKLYHAKFQN